MTTNTIFFSIIIPTFNRAGLISSTIKSILDQRDIEFEIIVVDDGSSDNTADVIQELRDNRIIYIKTLNRERGAARNSGLKIARGTYVNYFDSDDLLNHCLLDLSKFIVKNDFPDITYGLIENISDTGKSTGIVKPAYRNFKDSILVNNFLACGSVFIKRELALNNLFSEDRKLSGTEDWELWLRLYAKNSFVPSPIVIFQQRLHALRSLYKVSPQRVLERENAFIDHIHQHQILLQERFSENEIKLLVADRYTLIALSFSESASKNSVLTFLKKAFASNVWVIKRKRFWAILKKLILE